MQRPPSGRGLPLAPASPIHDSINRIAGKQSELTNVVLSADQQAILRAFVEREFTVSALGLTGVDVSREQIAVSQKSLDTRTRADSRRDRKIQSTLASISIVYSAIDRGELLNTDLLLRIHDPFREAAAAPAGQEAEAGQGVKESAKVMARISAFCQWTAADSFKELNPLEQAAIIVLRLLEIRPFEEGNVAAAVGAGSLFTMRAGWPPVIIPEHLRPKFKPAIGEGLKMNTRPLVDLLAESLYEALESSIEFIKDLRT